ncbi:Proliferation marker protein Ki-67 [Chionoecetes opilio]|uniref:Proliferation marker protein Ki-67 n=1 Tax=Chionoecetes opilio TaxID=41210 RepID=A0A8J4XLV7_CHIOP|nr:Proliferation marker protein Ki-67 [Chionoecetes opilio]
MICHTTAAAMKVLGNVVVIKRNGGDGTAYPMLRASCSIGRNADCDIRVQLNSVSQQQCRIDVDPSGKAYLTHLSHNSQTVVNGYTLAPDEVFLLRHKQVLSVGERQFRWEYPEGSTLATTVSIGDPSADYKILVPVVKSPVLPPFSQKGGFNALVVMVK